MLAVPSRVTVPSVVGSSISVAQQRLRSEGFKVEVVRDTSDKPRNQVIGQDPGGGESAEKGSTVTINVSDGAELVGVPDVVGEGRRAARRKLTDAGFEVQERRVTSDDVRVDRVVSQTPSGNSTAERGQTVTINVSSGPEKASVPEVVGKSEDDARAALERAGFRVTVTKREDDERDPGTVLEQSPAAGASAARGATITIVVAEEPKQVAVPNLVGATQDEATAILSRRGLNIVVEKEAVDSPDSDGVVQSQSPDPGAKVDRDTSVTITVGVFDPDLNPDPTPTPTQTTPTTTTAPPPAPAP